MYIIDLNGVCRTASATLDTFKNKQLRSIFTAVIFNLRFVSWQWTAVKSDKAPPLGTDLPLWRGQCIPLHSVYLLYKGKQFTKPCSKLKVTPGEHHQRNINVLASFSWFSQCNHCSQIKWKYGLATVLVDKIDKMWPNFQCSRISHEAIFSWLKDNTLHVPNAVSWINSRA